MSNVEVEQSSVIKGIYLLFLAVAGNFIAETLSCKTQKLLTNNIYVKQVITFLILFFALSFIETESPVNPLSVAGNAIVIYILFLMLTKMNPFFFTCAIALLTITYIINMYSVYYAGLHKENKKPNKNPEYKRITENFSTTKSLIFIMILTVILIGFITYAKKQYRDKNNFDITKLIFGVQRCTGG